MQQVIELYRLLSKFYFPDSWFLPALHLQRLCRACGLAGHNCRTCPSGKKRSDNPLGAVSRATIKPAVSCDDESDDEEEDLDEAPFARHTVSSCMDGLAVSAHRAIAGVVS